MKIDFKKIIPYIAAIAIFFIVSVAYFSPEIFQNKALHQNDVRKGYAAGVDLEQYKTQTGEVSLWASRMFSGMPSYQITPQYRNSSIFYPLRRTFEGWLPAPANHLFAYMLGFFILLMAFRVNPWIAIIGSVAFAFSSYHLIIITAGHIWKVRVLAFIPPTLAGIIWAYRGKLLLGGVITLLFFSLQLFVNHIQMTFYFLMFVGVYLIGRLVYDYKEKQLKRFAKATAVLLFAGIIGFGANATSLILTEKYTSQTIRGKSELTVDSDDKTGGLDRSYATGWSYGLGETFTLLIPNTKGGTSFKSIGQEYPSALDKADSRLRGEIANMPIYWGDQPGTSGPVYAGALIMFFFILGLFIVKGYMKWVLLAGTAFSVLLSWGSNFMWLTNLFLDYFPYYNKMRTVSSILVIAELCIPILAVLALVKLVEKPATIKENKKVFYASIGLTAGLILIFIAMPKAFFSFINSYEKDFFAKAISENPMYSIYRDSMEDVRVSIFRLDAWRSLFVISLGLGAILLFSKNKLAKPVFLVIIGTIVVLDMALVDKRYLNGNNFVPNSQAKVMWDMTPADAEVLKDKDPNYRVLNLTVSPFNDGSTSYHHKSIGGYHGAKIRRYQDIIDHYMIMRPDGKHSLNPNVINMLNTKYIITNPNEKPFENQEALGHAWFVEDIEWAENADAEIAYIENFNPSKVAIIDKRFDSTIQGFTTGVDSAATIVLEKYDINEITYRFTSSKDQLAVFSEVYYDDGMSSWDAYIDGQPTQVIRANYILRALHIPKGEHSVQFVFKPKAYGKLETLSMSCSIALLLALLALPAVYMVRKRKGLPAEVSDRNDFMA